MPPPEAIHKLVENFSTHIEHYKSSGYNETELRREYLDPFWKALGWDIDNEQGYADAYKDVIHEDAIKVGGYTKAPDYCFRIGGTRKFFLEAKKPSVSIKSDDKPAYQLRRYAWSAKLPLSVLSDFEELAVYDTRIRPYPKDGPAKARTFFCTYEDYIEKWDEIAAIFSREAVLKGSFDKYADTSKKKRGTAEVDDAFLEEIERWRDVLARNFALRNPNLSVRDLNYAVQKTIDRIIFLRICEDRGTEDYGRLNILQNGKNAWPRLNELFRRADERYNSGLFHFSEEKNRNDAPDRLTPGLALDDKVLKDIIKHLYYPDSPYEFSVLPADILGQVYEQFLGKTIRLTGSHQAKIEEKPEVRKAGGVYYTPTYIVDYIVANTLGCLLNGDEPNNKRPIPVSQAAKLKVCDPACGSGSFLIVAYQYLLDWHRDQYTLDPETGEEDEGKIKRHSAGKNPNIYQANGGGWKLTTPERKRILLNNIYGVDIDSQAVEVTKLSLLLKVLEGETQQQLQRDFISERQRILPDLGDNIQCGNSLIGPDFYEDEQLQLLEDEAKYRINVFDWESAFPVVFNQGGFDCVIGNPPYVRMELFKEVKIYLRSRYKCHDERSDLYAYFMEKGHNLLSPSGRFGFIVSNKFLRAAYGTPLRRFLLGNFKPSIIADFAGKKVFKGATVRTVSYISSKDDLNNFDYVPVPDTETFNLINSGSIDYCAWASDNKIQLNIDHLGSQPWTLSNPRISALMDRVSNLLPSLGEYAKGLVGMGIKSGCNQAFLISSEVREKLISENGKCAEVIKPFVNGREIRRYELNPKETFLLYMHHGIDTSNLSNLLEYLKPFKDKLESRATKQAWYELQQPQLKYSNLLEQPKIIFPDMAVSPRFMLDEDGYYTANTAYFIAKADKFLLGILNSKLGYTIFKELCAGLEGGNETYLRFFGQYLEKFPIRPIDFDNPDDVARHDKMVSLVERMLALHEQRTGESNPNTLKQIETQITGTDRQIDRLVYELYGLTSDEIQLVEQGATGNG
ncbi:N-6 DNA methylase [Puniceicoccales bacterium CK1056]|uniref:site-specific DNA-methyltransferase (adenine-specific) n=1 Tax=Oceanipulchritudo coccoides TaxID=2706888 RepID=A0A6B2M0U4_9BACT|nr:TaqI-like C-terminal specificity domain-containing protein [Oceanipulchritudo coccoides]NDV61657.1 N-6 DNA methylase [Oceanipulchritudo coccoides]